MNARATTSTANPIVLCIIACLFAFLPSLARAEVQLTARTFFDNGLPISSFPTNTGVGGDLIIYADSTTETNEVAGIEWSLKFPADIVKFSIVPPKTDYIYSETRESYPSNDFFYPSPMDSSRNYVSWTNSARFISPTARSGIPPKVASVAIYGFNVNKNTSSGFRTIELYNVRVTGKNGQLLPSSGSTKTIRLVPNLNDLKAGPYVFPPDWNRLPGTDCIVPVVSVDTFVIRTRTALETSHDLIHWTGVYTNEVLWNAKYAPVTNFKYYPATNHAHTFFRAVAFP